MAYSGDAFKALKNNEWLYINELGEELFETELSRNTSMKYHNSRLPINLFCKRNGQKAWVAYQPVGNKNQFHSEIDQFSVW